MDTESLILDYLYSRPQASQRELAVAVGASLGQINLIIRNLCKDGLLRQEQVSKKKVSYTLTQLGLAERARQINESIITALKDYKKVKKSVGELLDKLYTEGYREFILDGERNELHEVISEVFDEHFKGEASLIWGPPQADNGNHVVLNLGRRFVSGAKNVVNVLHEISL